MEVVHVEPVEQAEQGDQAGCSVGQHGDSSDAAEWNLSGHRMSSGERARLTARARSGAAGLTGARRKEAGLPL